MGRLLAVKPLATKPSKVKAIIYGRSGVGKTWFSLTFPTPYYIDCESGASLKHYQERLQTVGGAYMGVPQGSLDFPTVISQLQALAVEKHPYKTLIFDSITKLYQTAIANEAERLGEKDAFGASKKPAISKMRSLVNWCQRLDMNIFFVAHDTAEWGIVDGQRQEIGRVPDVWDKLVYELDLTLHVVKRGDNRSAVVKKSRLLGFPDQEMFDLDYANFAQRFGKDFIEADVTQLVLATNEQVVEIRRLIDLLKVPEEEVDKVLKKALADKIEELNTDQADATIKWLENKMKKETK